MSRRTEAARARLATAAHRVSMGPMTSGARHAFGVLLMITIAFAAIVILYTARTTHRLYAAQAAQAAAQRAGEHTQRQLNRTVRTLDRTVARLKREVRSNCRIDGHLAPLPVTVNPATGKAAELGVEIISDFRVAWRTAGCPGALPPAAPSFVRWARFYHLPAG